MSADGNQMSMDTSADQEEARWLTYPELAKARGNIDKPSAIRLATRRGWRRRKNNRGQMQVLVPIEELKSRDRSPDISADVADASAHASPDMSADISHALNALGDAVAVLREQLEVANDRADRAEQDRARAEERTERAEAARDTALAELARAEERQRQSEIERLVAAAAERSWLFSRLWRRR
jgi:hypothetical protein